ncbi:DNA (cytosine-5-)-methyltransferase [Mobiluncus mulieris]|uniref:DNA (cytosine-5-)-methyltransferase n=1 Tax=Mobiluncus mulieris TaxID=2052 RepID=A0A7Y0Y548_9ACTO|nr:DNA cytosine methyltransferase [Mobiluncus mulieris]NMW65659.1 DNA (cytosine-5-)-methyltransferase [Mobiluncus mulieris]
MTVTGIELFAGGGGLLLGSALAGVEHLAVAEWNRWACETIRENARLDYPLVRGVRVLEGDVRLVDWGSELSRQRIDIITAGPPCQPFSLGGVARSADDPRDMFPTTTAVIEKLRPRAFVIENVKGLTRAAFADYFEYIKLRLQHPELKARSSESWVEHFRRLQREHTSVVSDLQYRLVTTVVDAADYGVPQRRHRVFMVGFRSDVDAGWNFPAPTHSASALRAAQESGEYWERHRIAIKGRHFAQLPPVVDSRLPWRTVRDTLTGLPEPGSPESRQWLNHEFQPGAKAYPGHTGSPLDEPAKALKAGVHGVPGGENMIRFPDGALRYFSAREAARIQTFPDRYVLHGAWTETMRQLGNAVPVLLAQKVVSSVVEHLELDTALHCLAARQQRIYATAQVCEGVLA